MKPQATRYNHLDPATVRAIDLFRRYTNQRYYTDRQVRIEAAMVAEIPEKDMAEYVRITTRIQDGEE